jgi:hypothetical protein
MTGFDNRLERSITGQHGSGLALLIKVTTKGGLEELHDES